MLEVIICSVVGVCICVCGSIAWCMCLRKREDEVYVLDMNDSQLSFTFNEIYKDKNSISKV